MRLPAGVTRIGLGLMQTKQRRVSLQKNLSVLHHLTGTFRDMSVPISDQLEVLGLDLPSNYIFASHIECLAKVAAKTGHSQTKDDFITPLAA